MVQVLSISFAPSQERLRWQFPLARFWEKGAKAGGRDERVRPDTVLNSTQLLTGREHLRI
jgi:hypothetical protein